VKAHDESNQCHVGDRVMIVECRPLSRDKRWRVSKVLQRSQAAEAERSVEAGV
jgi:small subunit ribosomal protein S17